MTPINLQELNAAIAEIEEVSLDRDLAYSIAAEVNDKKDRMPFGEAIRYSLNELHVWNKQKRRLYARVIGKYFGRRGGHKTANLRRSASLVIPSQKPPKKKSVTGTIVLEKEGQLALKL